MKKEFKNVLILGFALFSMFFGAGNLIFPSFLGFHSGKNWLLVAIGFFLTAIGLPLLGIAAHARLQGNLFDFGKPVSKIFSHAFAYSVFFVALVLASPRTSAVTYELGIEPYFNISSNVFIPIYFLFVFIFLIKRNSIVNYIGKIATPSILIILILLIYNAVTRVSNTQSIIQKENFFSKGFIEGYQTMDAFAAILVGSVIVNEVRIMGYTKTSEKYKIVFKSGVVAAILLGTIYGGLIYTGTLGISKYSNDISRTDLLLQLSYFILGNNGGTILAILVSLACFTTSIGIITPIADYFKETFQSVKVYYLVSAFGCLIGALIGCFGVTNIVNLAVPVLFLIYPTAIVLIVLHVVPQNWTNKTVFKWTSFVTVLFSFPSALTNINLSNFQEFFKRILNYMPLSEYSLEWFLPVIITFLICIIIKKTQ